MKKIGLFLLATQSTAIYSGIINQESSLSKEEQMKLHSFYNGKRVLVTGGAGFIGSEIVEMLVSYGAHVTIIDDLSTGFESNLKNVSENITFIKESIVNKESCDKAVAGNDIIFHLAAYTSVPGSVANPDTCHYVNVDGMYNLLVAARKHAVKRIVFSSTSAVYGPREDVCRETDTNLNPISPYGATKLMGEIYGKQFSLLYGIEFVMLRYFNVYGPRQNPNSQYAAAVAKFTQCMANNLPITIFGDGTQTRDFVSVTNVAEANLIVGMAPSSLVDKQVFNIGTGTSVSILDLIKDLKTQFTAYTHMPVFAPARDGDVKHTKMSSERFNQLKESL